MKKLIIFILCIIISLSSLSLYGCGKKLAMKEDEFISYVGNGLGPCWSIESTEFKNEEDKKEAIYSGLIEVDIQNTDIATLYYDRGEPCIRSKAVGETEIKLTYKGKTAVIVYKVYSILDYLSYEADNDGNIGFSQNQYLGCLYLMNNIEAFKDPSSVEVTKVVKHTNDSGKVDYFMMEIRAKNSFGAYNVDWFKITLASIDKGYSPYLVEGIGLMYDGFSPAGSVSGDAQLYTQAVKEYCESK